MNIIGFAGGPRSGKDSSLKYIMGSVMVKNDVTSRFSVNENGELLVNSLFADGEFMGVFDTDRKDEVYINYASQMIWPYVKNYHFATYLKFICMNMYGLTYDQCYGNGKQDLVKYTWNDILPCLPTKLRPKGVNKDDQLTARQFMQYIADVLRAVNDKVFVDPVVNDIKYDMCPLSLIGDVRRVCEVETIKEMGGKVILLKRRLGDDTHRIENEFVDCDESMFDAVIDNQDMSMDQKNSAVFNIVQSWGYLE